jgi:two-component system nitrogen regulation response regulator NtrX
MDAQDKAKVLIVDDEGPIRQVLSATLRDEGYRVELAENGEAGLIKMREFQPEVVLLDIWMPGRLDGIAVLTEARKEFPQIDIVMMSGHGTIETAVRATRLGAWDFI